MSFRLIAICLLSVTCVSSGNEPNFRGVMPKVEIGASRFLHQHPEFDGRGVKVAIFDTGVDPGVVGLWTTSHGQPKVIDVVDGTGSGDVDTSEAIAIKNGVVMGKTGRSLQIPAAWQNPSGQYHVGIKRAYDFFPGSLINRLKRERREKWNSANEKAIVDLKDKMLAWDADKKTRTADERRLRSDMNDQLAQLKHAAQRYDDPGPVYDCVVFHDGKTWQAAIDTDEDGDLADEKLMTNYRIQRQFSTFKHGSELNFALNIYDNGNLLSVVIDSSPHGTHCAGIVAGNYPDQPGLNGIAPGAQIISVKIGDSRLGTMESSEGIERGLRTVIEHDADIISMSYGEIANLPNRGRLIEKMSQIVNDHGVIYVAAAGNWGPALSTVIAPGGSTSALIGVGAHISPEMMAAQYSTTKPYDGLAYTWTSRGPNYDGDLGVDIMAPGGAFAAVPRWTLHKQMQMNGTSMATPNAAGGIALLLSALKSTKTPYSPHSVHRAIQNSAKPLPNVEPFASGPGMLQVGAALEYLLNHQKANAELLRVVPTLSGSNKRGIYLRDAVESTRALDQSIQLKPLFRKDVQNKERLDFEMMIDLESSSDWIEVGDRVFLQQDGRRFPITVDPTSLLPGVHYAEVLGYDAKDHSRGPMFRFPVTVVKPHILVDESQFSTTLDFDSGEVHRQFIHVPDNATIADIRLELLDEPKAKSKRLFVLHASQIRPQRHTRHWRNKHFLTLNAIEPNIRTIEAEAGHTLELCLAQFWSTLGKCRVRMDVTFHGLQPTPSAISLADGSAGVSVEVASTIRDEHISPKAVLDRWRQIVRPSSSTIQLLSADRDTQLDGKRVYELINTYRFNNAKTGNVTPFFPLCDEFFYDSEAGPRIWTLRNAAGRTIANGDVFPAAKRMEKGQLELKLFIRADSESALQKYSAMPMHLERGISAINLPIFASRLEARHQAARVGTRSLPKGARRPMFLLSPKKSQVGYASAGDVMLGRLTIGGKSSAQLGTGARPGGYPIQFVVGPDQTKPASQPKPVTTQKAGSAQALSDFKLSELQRINFESDRATFDKLAAEFADDDRNFLKVLALRLERLDNVKHRKERLPEVVKAADAIIEKLDQNKIANALSPHADKKSKPAGISDKRDLLIDTLYRKGRALGYMELPDVVAKFPIKDPKAHDKAFEDNFTVLQRWVNTTDKDYALLHIRRDRRKARNGAALKLLNKLIDGSEPYYWYHKKRREIYEVLGWQHLWEYEKRWLVIKFPNGFK